MEASRHDRPRRNQRLIGWAASGIAVVALAVAVPMIAAGDVGAPAQLSATGATSALTAAQRPIIPGTLSQAATATTDLGTASMWRYEVNDGGLRGEVMLSAGGQPLAIGTCPPNAAAAFCIAYLGGPGSPLIVAGTAASGAATVSASYADGTTVTAPVQNGSWVMQLPGSNASGVVSESPREFTTRAGDGTTLVHSDLGVPTLIAQHNSAPN